MHSITKLVKFKNNDDARQYSAEATSLGVVVLARNAVTEDLIDKHMDAYAKKLDMVVW